MIPAIREGKTVKAKVFVHSPNNYMYMTHSLPRFPVRLSLVDLSVLEY